MAAGLEGGCAMMNVVLKNVACSLRIRILGDWVWWNEMSILLRARRPASRFGVE